MGISMGSLGSYGALNVHTMLLFSCGVILPYSSCSLLMMLRDSLLARHTLTPSLVLVPQW